MSDTKLTQTTDPSQPTNQRMSGDRCGIAPHRGDVTTVHAAAFVRLQETKRIEKLQAHVPSHRTAGTVPVPVTGFKNRPM